MKSDQRIRSVLWVVALACALIGFVSVAGRRQSSTIDSANILHHVEAIARVPHPLGSTPSEDVQRYLIDSLSDLGLEPRLQEFVADDYFGSPDRKVTGANVLARINGLASERATLLIAHHDSVPTTPGANDNAAAVAALLEVARALTTSAPPSDVILLFTDGEEPAPRYGAEAFVAHEWFADVGLVANFEAIGSSGPSLLVETSGALDPLIGHLSAAVSDVVGFSFVTDVTNLLGDVGTDFDVMRREGVPGYNFAFIRGSSIYHTPRDDVDSLNTSGATHHAAIGLGLAMQPIPDISFSDDGDVVFFTAPASYLVRYSGFVPTATIIAALLGVALVVVFRVRRGESSAKSLGAGVLFVMLVTAVAAIAGTVLWYAIVRLRPEMSAVESFGWLALLACVMAVAWWITDRGLGDANIAVLVVWGAFAALLSPWLVGTATLFALPCLVASVGLMASSRWRGLPTRVLSTVAISVAVGIIVLPAIDVYFQFAAPRPGNPDSEVPAAIVLPIVLAYLVIGLIAAAPDDDRRPAPERRSGPPEHSVDVSQPA